MILETVLERLESLSASWRRARRRRGGSSSARR